MDYTPIQLLIFENSIIKEPNTPIQKILIQTSNTKNIN